MIKLCERAAYLASVVALLTVLSVGVSNKVGALMNTARAQDMEIDYSGKTCPETSGPDCSYSGCYSNCDAGGCHPSCAGQGRSCKDSACT
jgi:hypothetical protein